MPPITDEELASEAHRSLLVSIGAARDELEDGVLTAEELRSLPKRSVEVLGDLGVFWLKTPSSLGGTPLDPLQFSDVIEELAYIEPSAAWAAMIGAGSTGLAAAGLPEEGAKEVFLGQASLPVFASQPQPRGLGHPVEKGFVVSGRWSFASGIRHADWLLGAFHPAGDGGRPGGTDLSQVTAFVVPKRQVEVIDNWYVAGLQGTGSADFQLSEVFVPQAHTYRLFDASNRSAAGRRYGPLFGQDPLIFVGNELPPFCVGSTRRAIDDMVELAGSTRSRSGVLLADRPVFRQELGVAQVRLRAVQLLYRDTIRVAWEATRRGLEVTDRDRAAVATAQTYVAETCAEIITGLFRYGGGRAITLNHPMQRHLRNALAVRQHVAATEEHYETAGRARLGGGHPQGSSATP